MSETRSQPEQLDYQAARARRRRSRGLIVSFLGGSVAAAGVLVFLLAHELVGKDYDSLAGEHARLHELLWAAFGIALLLSGAAIAAVGLAAWCRSEAS